MSSSYRQEFLRRAERVTPHGLGLSVDIYQPDLFELLTALQGEAVACDYLEVFRATQPAAEAVRTHLPGGRLECHAEGLWMTQPDWREAYPAEAEMSSVAGQLRSLGSQWVTHECAAKQMAGYSFGTYLPPLLTAAGAAVTADNSLLLQDRLDRDAGGPDGLGPLVLLEMPPLTYFVCGELSVPAFFRHLADRTSCGLVLDIGHLWTVYRYSGSWRRLPLTAFVDEFLDVFPLERVVQIHVAGLAPHEAVPDREAAADSLPLWIDAHGAAIPEVLFEMLAQVLAHPGLTQLKGLALEVDTKAIACIVEELRLFRRRFEGAFRAAGRPGNRRGDGSGPDTPAPVIRPASGEVPASEREVLRRQYEDYARLACGQSSDGPPLVDGGTAGLRLYRDYYLPHEILHWGGDIREIFPASCRALEEAGVPVADFVDFWSRAPRAVSAPYDFFLLKLDRFMEFVGEMAPAAGRAAAREAADLRAAYLSASDLAACDPAAGAASCQPRGAA